VRPTSASSTKTLRLAKAALLPLLLAQALYVKRKALELPEAAGARAGEVMPPTQRLRLLAPLRLLVVGDSSAAGVGVAHQRDALATQLALSLADELGRPVHWQLIARTGHTSIEALAHAREAGAAGLQADILVTALGVNDVVRQIPQSRSLEQLEQLHAWARETAGVRYWLHSGLPALHQFPRSCVAPHSGVAEPGRQQRADGRRRLSPECARLCVMGRCARSVSGAALASTRAHCGGLMRAGGRWPSLAVRLPQAARACHTASTALVELQAT
jgi:lysophospholipase L1-like esterase